MFFHQLADLDMTFWKDEKQINPNAQKTKDKINVNLKLGYFGSIKRTMG